MPRFYKMLKFIVDTSEIIVFLQRGSKEQISKHLSTHYCHFITKFTLLGRGEERLNWEAIAKYYPM